MNPERVPAAAFVPALDPARADLMPGELIRIYIDPATNMVSFKHRGLGEARSPVAAVLAAIDRDLLVAEIIQRLRSLGRGNGQP